MTGNRLICGVFEEKLSVLPQKKILFIFSICVEFAYTFLEEVKSLITDIYKYNTHVILADSNVLQILIGGFI